MEGIDIQSIVRQVMREEHQKQEQEDIDERELARTCGRQVYAAELVEFLGEVSAAGTEALLRLLGGPEVPSKATCADVGSASRLLCELAKALARIGGR